MSDDSQPASGEEPDDGTDAAGPGSEAAAVPDRDSPQPATARGQPGRGASPRGGPARPSGGMPAAGGEKRTVREYVFWAGLVVCGLVTLVAFLQFYVAALDAINEWVDPAFRSVFRAVFSLAVVVAGLIGVSLTVRELSEDG